MKTKCWDSWYSNADIGVPAIACPRLTLCDLYAALDVDDDAGDGRRAHRKEADRKAPSLDTAQDIIARTILKIKGASLAER
jgi:hypothetical protein